MNPFKGLNKSDNKAVILMKPNQLKVDVWPLEDKLEPNDCLLESKSNGICGTDLHLWKKGIAADFELKEPLVLGHEPSALVLAVGSAVKNLKAGDRVTIEPFIACHLCEYCRTGRHNLCSLSFRQSRGLSINGCLRKYYTHPSICCFKVPDNVSWDEASMVEPFAVVVHACRRVKLAVGDNVLVCGAGPVGIMAMLCAKAFGAAQVSITDINQSRLKMAKQLGADYTFLVDPKNFNDLEFATNIQKDLGYSPDTTFECSGAGTSVSMAMFVTKTGGRVCCVGLGAPKINVPMSSATMREIEIIGSSRINDEYPLAIQLISSGKVNLKPLVSHRFKIDNAIEAFELLGKGAEGVVKVIIEY